jgi:hypothetical protein
MHIITFCDDHYVSIVLRTHSGPKGTQKECKLLTSKY